ncbi:MAG: hypothetical protein K9G30_05265, partial [Parvibaculum sp.]|nr:hypothetical protein [Parvibaculum sp.]
EAQMPDFARGGEPFVSSKTRTGGHSLLFPPYFLSPLRGEKAKSVFEQALAKLKRRISQEGVSLFPY